MRIKCYVQCTCVGLGHVINYQKMFLRRPLQMQ